MTRNRDAGHQQTAGVAAQVEHVALDLLLLEILQRLRHVLGGIGVELLQADVADLGAIGTGVDLGIDRMQLNPSPHEGGIDQLAVAAQLQGHRAAGLPSDQLDRILGRHPLGALAIDRRDDVLRHHPRAGCGRPFDGTDDGELFGVLIEAQLNPDPGEFPRGVDLHLLELTRIEETRVGIVQGRQHAPDRLIALLGAAVTLGEHLATQVFPLVRGVFAVGIEIVPEDDLPGLINDFLRAVAHQRGRTRQQQRRQTDGPKRAGPGENNQGAMTGAAAAGLSHQGAPDTGRFLQRSSSSPTSVGVKTGEICGLTEGPQGSTQRPSSLIKAIKASTPSASGTRRISSRPR